MYCIIDSNRQVIAEAQWNTFEACAKMCYEIGKRSLAREPVPCLVLDGTPCVKGLQLGLAVPPPVATLDELVLSEVSPGSVPLDGPSFKELGF